MSVIATKNVLLRELEPPLLARYRDRLQLIEFSKGEVLQESGEAVDWVYFPESGLIALASETLAGEVVAGETVGWDGAVGVFEACGSRRTFARAVVQIPGAAWRVRAAAYRELFDQSAGLRAAVHRHVELLLVESRQLIACNAIHTVESRLARAVLDALDRSGSGPLLPLTQEALAQMLGVQRSTVTLCAAALQRARLIRNVRGAIEVLDQAGLEKAACACRATIAFARDEIHGSLAQACEA
jgi:CRP-like cAMP-binding protein